MIPVPWDQQSFESSLVRTARTYALRQHVGTHGSPTMAVGIGWFKKAPFLFRSIYVEVPTRQLPIS